VQLRGVRSVREDGITNASGEIQIEIPDTTGIRDHSVGETNIANSTVLDHNGVGPIAKT